MSYSVFKFGALYLDDKIQPIPQQPIMFGDIPKYDGQANISIASANQEKSITWVKPSGLNLLVADRVLLVDVSWQDLNNDGFVAGKRILIDGQYFRCRLLQVGAVKDKGVPNEWDKALNETVEDNTLWHWEEMYFLGADISAYGMKHRAVRGYSSARYWSDNHAARRNMFVGFRPALEPLPADDATPNINLDGIDFCLRSIPGGESFYPILQPIQEDVFADIPVGGKVRMYTLMENGHPIHMDEQVRSVTKLTLTDHYFGDEFLIPWVISNGVAVVNQSLPQQEKS